MLYVIVTVGTSITDTIYSPDSDHFSREMDQVKFDTLVKENVFENIVCKGGHFVSAPSVLHSYVFYWYIYNVWIVYRYMIHVYIDKISLKI